MSINIEERQRARAMKVAQAAMAIRARAPTSDPMVLAEEVRMAALAAIAESRAVWAFLRAKNLVTEREHQDYLDIGVRDLLAQIDGKAAEILTEPGRA